MGELDDSMNSEKEMYVSEVRIVNVGERRGCSRTDNDRTPMGEKRNYSETNKQTNKQEQRRVI